MVMLFDSSAWIEFFVKSEKGAKVKRYLEAEECYTSIVSIAEISNWAVREKVDGKELVRFVIGSTGILDLNHPVAFLAGELNYQRKKIEKTWGMVDSLILSTALFYNLKILTKDSQFKDLTNAELL